MEVLQEDNIWKLSFDKQVNFLQSNWTGLVLSEDIFKEKMLQIAEAVKTHQPQGFLANTLQFNFSISPDLQTWHNDTLFPVFESVGLKKMAIVVAEDIFSQVSIEQAYEENDYGFVTQYFDGEQEAREWLSQEN